MQTSDIAESDLVVSRDLDDVTAPGLAGLIIIHTAQANESEL